MPEQYQYDYLGYIGDSRISVCTDALGSHIILKSGKDTKISQDFRSHEKAKSIATDLLDGKLSPKDIIAWESPIKTVDSLFFLLAMKDMEEVVYMEIGNRTWDDLEPFDRGRLLKAYDNLLTDKIFYAIQEEIPIEDVDCLVGQSQYFELRMEEKFPGFTGLKENIKMYLFKRLKTDLLYKYQTILTQNCVLMENLMKVDSGEIDPFRLDFQII